MTMITLALSKGRIFEETLPLLKAADKVQALQLGTQRVHHKTRHGREHGGALAGAGLCAGQGQQGDEFVRPVAQHDAVALGHVGILGEGRLQIGNAIARIAVERQRAQALAQRRLQVRGQAERVLHGVHLEHAGGGLHHIRVHGTHVRADAGQGVQRGG